MVSAVEQVVASSGIGVMKTLDKDSPPSVTVTKGRLLILQTLISITQVVGYFSGLLRP